MINRLFQLSIFLTTSLCASAVEYPPLQLPAVPATITDIPARADFVMAHYWDNLDISRQPARAASPQWLEQSVVDYLSLLPHATPQGHADGFAATIIAFAPDHTALLSMADLMEKYLDATDSPMFSEKHYIEFLSQLTRAGVLDSTESVRPLYQLEALQKNRPGTIAADFSYIDRNNTPRTLHTTPAAHLLLIFYDPDCDHCAATMRDIISDTALSMAVTDGSLSILAIYADGEADIWTEAATRLPDSWLGGLDTSGLQEQELYTVRDLPSLYLLDADKTVLLKNPSIAELCQAVAPHVAKPL